MFGACQNLGVLNIEFDIMICDNLIYDYFIIVKK